MTKPDDRREARERLARWWVPDEPWGPTALSRWNPFEDNDQAEALLTKIEDQGLQWQFVEAFTLVLYGKPSRWSQVSDLVWRAIRATPAQISEAVLAVIDGEEPDP